jgi:hypothetical protein
MNQFIRFSVGAIGHLRAHFALYEPDHTLPGAEY